MSAELITDPPIRPDRTRRGPARSPGRAPARRREARTEPLRVAMIAPPWIPVPPTAYGGTEAAIDALCRGLAAAGHEVLLVASGDSTCAVERCATVPRALGTEAVSPAAELAHACAAHRAARDWGADVVHDHTLGGPGLAAAIPAGPAVCTTNHGTFDGDLATIYTTVAGLVPTIAISHDQARRGGAISIAAVIHHGVDTDAVVPTLDRPGGPALFLGRMSPSKGLPVAIEVARRAGVELVIAAKMREPDERRYFEEVVRPLLGGGVDYVGEVDRAAQFGLLASASCLLNPVQWDEPFGMVVIEALACGTPVVATPRGAMRELIVDGVTGCLRATVDGLVDAVSAVGELDRAVCRADAERRFSKDVTARRHAAFYQEVIAARSAADLRRWRAV